MTKLKTDFEFKQGDVVDCSQLSTEQVEAILERMWELGGNKMEDAGELSQTYYNLNWQDDNDVWFSSKPFGYHNYHLREVKVEDIFPETITLKSDSVLNLYEDEDMQNCKTILEENFQDVTKWKCFEQVASVLGEAQAEYELKKVLLADLDTLLTEGCLLAAFEWSEAPQGYMFWKNVNNGTKPENYDTTPDVPPTPEADKPKLVIPDSVLEEIKVTFEDGLSETPEDEHLTVAYPSESNEQTIGNLIEDLYNKLPDSGVQIVFSGAGIYLTGLNMPTVDVSKMEPEVIDKTFEMFVECEGLWVLPEEGFEESGEV